MSEVVVLASLVARPGKEAEAEKFLLDLVTSAHGDEGCVLFALHRGADDPRRFTFVERWASRDLLEQHLAGEHLQSALQRAGELFSQAPEITVYEAVPGGENDKGSLSGNAGS